MFLLCSKRMIPANVDQFLCCGTRYRAVRDAVAKFLLEKTSDAIKTEMKVFFLSFLCFSLARLPLF